MDSDDQLFQYLAGTGLDGLDELDPGDVITGAVVLLRVERPSEEGSAMVMATAVDYFSQLGMLTAAMDLVRSDEE